jgi:hypothetical protein
MKTFCDIASGRVSRRTATPDLTYEIAWPDANCYLGCGGGYFVSALAQAAGLEVCCPAACSFPDFPPKIMATTPSIFDDPERWRRRAAEMRKVAAGMAHLPNAQASLLRTAEEYDRLADRAEKRAGR